MREMHVLKATPKNIRVASRIVKDGGLVVYPTDTVYGLGCDPLNVKAIKRVFRVKGDREKPLPILSSSVADLEKVAHFSDVAREIAAKFWPGPLTIIVPKKPVLPSVVTCGLGSVGMRVPKHDIALQLIRLSAGLLVGTSANKMGQRPPRTAFGAAEQLGEGVDVILDGGSTPLGISSTVVDLAVEEPRILREGPISFEDISEVLAAK
jgi:L-threonylcarbamoyladenylate synthase